MAEGTLSLDALMGAAAARAGTDDWGDRAFTEPLQLLLESCQENAALTTGGGQVLRRFVLRHLGNRLDLQRAFGSLPHNLTMPVAPIVITGLPRTGTTVLHHLLAQDPQGRVLRLWEALRPGPAAGADDAARRALVAQAESWVAGFRALAPEFTAIHAVTAQGPEECDTLLQNAFASQHVDDMFDAPRYSDWFADAPLRAEYHYYVRQLAVLGTAGQTTHEPTPRWVLKSPGHLGHLDALLDVLPDAVVVQCHREPTQAVASYASLIRAVRTPHTERIDPHSVGRQALHRACLAMTRAMRARDAAPDRFVDVAYTDLLRDPLGVVAAIYDHLGQSTPEAAAAGMRRWLADNPQHRHGRHSYGLGEFGLNAAQVTESFAGYLDRFAALLAG